MQTAPFMLTMGQDLLPNGEFLLPVCINKPDLIELMNTLKQAQIYGEPEINGFWRILESFAYIQDPENAPCFPPSACEEDTYGDSVIGFIDEILSNLQSGGISKAVGYVIDELGEIIIETALKVIAITVIGGVVGGVVNILVGGVSVGTTAIGAGEVVEIITKLPTSTPTNIITFVYDAVA